MKLSILICTVDGREKSFRRLIEELDRQISDLGLLNEVEIIHYKDNCKETVGFKRNWLKKSAIGKYICYIDDDDMVSINYLKIIFEAMISDPDIITFNVQKYVHGMINQVYCPNVYMGNLTLDNLYFMNNLLHLCPHKKSFSDKIEFPEKNLGEDYDYSQSLIKLSPIEKRIEDILYYYYFSYSETLTQK